MSQTTAASRPPVLPRGLLIVVGLAATVIAVGGLKAVGGLLGPAFLALVLMITVFPVRGWLVRLRVPGWLATLVTILVVYAVLAAMVVALVVSVGRLAALVPTYSPQINDLVDKVGELLRERGVKQTQVNAVIKSLDFGKLFGYATTVLQSMLSVLSNAFFIAVLVLFMGFDAARFPRHLRDARGERPAVVTALLSFAVGTRHYFAVSAGFGLVVAVVDWIALLVIGIPAAGVWGVLSFVTNFIPNIGFVVGLVPPAVLGLLEGGVGEMVVVIVVYVVINFVIQTVIQPKIVGDQLGLSATVTFLSLVFWSWVLGPLGALLAIPMTLLAKALLVDVDPNARWVVPLISGRPNGPPGGGTGD
ncbi:AI-2E family transporter [Nocardioides mangrovicus]|nr:AI-2E family transporter [Nocardioides mangrovicus]